MRILLLLMLVAMLIFNVGCRKGAAIQNVQANTIATTAAEPFKEQDVRKAILSACALRGWQAREILPGLIEARLIVRGKHTVIVDIPYTAANYSINYKSSSNMEYKTRSDGTTVIHPNYNKWVSLLHADISGQLARASR